MLALFVSAIASKQLIKPLGLEYKRRNVKYDQRNDDLVSTLDVAEKLVSAACEGETSSISSEELLQCLKDLEYEENGKKFTKFMKKLLHAVIEFIVYKYGDKNSATYDDSYTYFDADQDSDEHVYIEEEENFAIPSWVITTLKWLLQEFIKEVVSKYQIKVYWDANYKKEFKACIISLVHSDKEQFTRTTVSGETITSSNTFTLFTSHVKTSFNKIVGNKFPVKLKFENYKGNPSAILYWK